MILEKTKQKKNLSNLWQKPVESKYCGHAKKQDMTDPVKNWAHLLI